MVTLRIFLYGLLTFVADGDHLTVLLIDARNPPIASDGCPIHAHRPLLITEAAECPERCEMDGGLCRCTLDEMKVTVPPAAGRRSTHPISEEDLRYVPDLPAAQLTTKDKVRSDCYPKLGGRGVEDRDLCDYLAAYSRFTPEEDGVCDCLLGHGGKPLRFRPLTLRGRILPYRRVAVEVMMARVPSQDPDGDGYVELQVVSFDGTESYPVKIRVQRRDCAGERCCEDEAFAELVLANVREPEEGGRPAYARCRNERVLREFELLHDLMHKPFKIRKRPVPQVEETRLDDAQPTGHCPSSPLLDRFLAELPRAGEVRVLCSPAEGK